MRFGGWTSFLLAAVTMLLALSQPSLCLSNGNETTVDMDELGQDGGSTIIIGFYRVLKPIGAFDKLVNLYINQSMSITEREEKAVDYLSQLPEEVRQKLPIPSGFMKYEPSVREKIRAIYYSGDMSYRKKLVEMAKVLEGVPDPEVRFQVNVTLTRLDGIYAREQMEQVLSADEMVTITDIQSNKTLTPNERWDAIGVVLQNAYTNPANASRRANWPNFQNSERIPAVVKDALKNLYFEGGNGREGGKNASLWVRVYREEVSPYLPGGPKVRRWLRECPCKEHFWAANENITTTTTTTTTSPTNAPKLNSEEQIGPDEVANAVIPAFVPDANQPELVLVQQGNPVHNDFPPQQAEGNNQQGEAGGGEHSDRIGLGRRNDGNVYVP